MEIRNRILEGDALSVLGEMAAESVDGGVKPNPEYITMIEKRLSQGVLNI